MLASFRGLRTLQNVLKTACLLLLMLLALKAKRVTVLRDTVQKSVPKSTLCMGKVLLLTYKCYNAIDTYKCYNAIDYNVLCADRHVNVLLLQWLE